MAKVTGSRSRSQPLWPGYEPGHSVGLEFHAYPGRSLMRPSKRDDILDAAVAVLESDGIAAVTFESVAKASGITKGGLIYHFSSKQGLFQAMHDRKAAQWEEQLQEKLGAHPETATVAERVAAYARVSAHRATSADLLLMLSAANTPSFRASYSAVSSRWVPDASTLAATDPASLRLMNAVLAADGLWASDGIGELRLSQPQREALADHIVRTLTDS